MGNGAHTATTTATTKTVAGVELTGRPGCWRVPGTDHELVADDHHRVWDLHTPNGGELCFARTLDEAIAILRRRGVIAGEGS